MNCPHCNKPIEFTCARCQHVWTPRKGELPKICPKCKRKKWMEAK